MDGSAEAMYNTVVRQSMMVYIQKRNVSVVGSPGLNSSQTVGIHSLPEHHRSYITSCRAVKPNASSNETTTVNNYYPPKSIFNLPMAVLQPSPFTDCVAAGCTLRRHANSPLFELDTTTQSALYMALARFECQGRFFLNSK